tara:strand:- start:48 stop:524 length:477 start_codon:yes stop_codon:yes gene_type:complete
MFIVKTYDPMPIRVITHRIAYSLNLIPQPRNSKYATQSNPLIIKPENMVDNDHVDAINDKASVLFPESVFLIINGNEQTLIKVIPNPQARKDSCIRGVIDNRIDSITKTLVSGTVNAASWKNGLRFFPRIYIPSGNAKASAPTNLSELNDAISGSEYP